MNDQPQRQDGEPLEEQARREPVLNLPPVVIALIAICVVVYVVGAELLSADAYDVLLDYAAFHSDAVSLAALPTLVTYSFLHGSITHLAVNMVWLAAFGSPLANRLGWRRFLVFWAVTAACAAALYWLLHSSEPIVLVGASGAISGMTGAVARFGFRINRSHGNKAAFSGEPLPVLMCLRLRAVVVFLAIWFAINLLTGLVQFTPGVDAPIAWEAHIAGFLVGFLGLGWFDRGPGGRLPPDRSPDDEEATDAAPPSGRPA